MMLPYYFLLKKAQGKGGSPVPTSITIPLELLSAIRPALGGYVLAHGIHRGTKAVVSDFLSSEEGYIPNLRLVVAKDIMRAPSDSSLEKLVKEQIYLAQIQQLEDAITERLAEEFANDILKDMKKRK